LPSSSTFTYIQTNINLDVNVSEFGYLNIESGNSLYSTVKNLEIKSGATLIVSGTLEVYDLVFYNGSNITINTGGVIIVHNNFTNKNNSDNVIGKWFYYCKWYI